MLLQALVLPLLAKWDPGAIIRFVIAIVVAAFDRKIILISISKCPITKRYERKPFIADCDAASTIVLEPYGLWIAASIEHTAPNSRKPSSASIVYRMQLPADIDTPASAGFCVSGSQVACGGQDFVAAGTATVPTDMVARIVAVAADPYDGQSTKRLAGDINDFGQGDLLARLLCQVTGWRFNAGPSRILAQSIPA